MPAPRRYSFALQSGETSDFLAVVDLPADVAEGDEGEEEDADELGEAVEILEVVCPDGVRAGDTIFLQYGADEIEVVVPEGIGPGDEFEVNLASESRDEQQTSVGDRIDDALDPTFVDAAAIAALIDEARSNTGHPGVLPLEAKLEALREKVRAPIESATDSAVAGSQPEPDAEIDLEKLLGDSAATLYGGASAQKPKKAKKPQRGQQVPKKPMKKTSGGPGSEAVGPGQLRLSGSELDRKVEQKMAALESKFSGSSPQARNRSNSLREFAKDQMQMIEAVVALDSEAKLAAVDEAEALETAAEAAAKAEAEAEAARAAAAKDAIESAAVAKVQQAAAVAEEALLAEADETKAAQAKLVEEAKQHAAALKAGNAARTKLERENSDLRSENSTLRRELAQLRIGQEVAEIGWRDERALHQEVIAAYARERELHRQNGPSWSMRTHAEVMAEIERVRQELAPLVDESAPVGHAGTGGSWAGALGRPPAQAARRASQKTPRSVGANRGNSRSTSRGRGRGTGKGKSTGKSKARKKSPADGTGKEGKQPVKSTHESSAETGLSFDAHERQDEIDAPTTESDSDAL